MNFQTNSFLQDAIHNIKINNFAVAKIILLKVLDIEPFNFDALNILGVIFGQENNHIEALNFFKKAQQIKPYNNLINFNLAKAFSESGNDLEAIKYYKIAIGLDKNYLGSWIGFGNSLHTLKRYDEALSNYDQAIKLKPDYAEAYYNKAITLNELQSYDEALSNYDQAIKLKPDYAEAYYNKAISLKGLQSYDEALSNYDQAIKLKPDYANAYNNKGNIFRNLQRYDEALFHYHKAISLKSDYFYAYNNLGLISLEKKKLTEAFNFFETCLKINPKFLEPYYNESFIFLLQNEFIEGWKRYEYRWVGENQKPSYDLNDNAWNGDFLDGTLLVWSEQGLGDHLFFGRMLQCVTYYAKKIVFSVDKRIIQLFKDFLLSLSINNIEVIEHDKKKLFIDFDKHIPSGSLGKFFANSHEQISKFSDKSFVINKKYKKIDDFLANFKGLKVGLSWKTLNQEEQHRSIPLEKLVINLKKNFNIINLQFGKTDEEINKIDRDFGLKIHNYKGIDNLNDIYELCYLIKNLDLIITVQNTTAHLSLGLQKKTFLLLPVQSRWQWGLNGNDSVWYPTAHIFRQSKEGDWEDVLNNIKIELNK
jgi:tetratricopeptide (TPR) repeat protein